MEAYKKLQEFRDKLGLTDEEFVQFITELNEYTEKILDGKNKDSSNSTKYSDEEKFLRRILAEIGVPTHIRGHRYLITAILLCIKDSTYYDAISKALYPKVAKEHNTTPTRTERAIRHAIEAAWDRGNMEFQDKMFSYSVSSKKGKPENSLFITTFSEYIKVYLPEWRSGTWEP